MFLRELCLQYSVALVGWTVRRIPSCLFSTGSRGVEPNPTHKGARGREHLDRSNTGRQLIRLTPLWEQARVPGRIQTHDFLDVRTKCRPRAIHQYVAVARLSRELCSENNTRQVKPMNFIFYSHYGCFKAVKPVTACFTHSDTHERFHFSLV